MAEIFASDERMPAEERLDAYANMYFFRLRDVLAEDFERTAAALGEARWHNLVTDYLLAHPPTRWSLRWAGEALPGFLREHTYGVWRPWLPDVAALEWARPFAEVCEAWAPEGPDETEAAEEAARKAVELLLKWRSGLRSTLYGAP
ncbi:MAG: putative DNA-binding domain-containing protein [Holophagales bacterium]|nr:putative DNA-binding domain-containing protein [Holophagales bacterium]